MGWRHTHPPETHRLVDLGTVLFYGGKRDDALQYYEQALALVPDSEIIHHNLAVIYALRGDDERAEVHRRAKWDSMFVVVFWGRGLSLSSDVRFLTV
jgi:tetratricopeptide (TPR) repeat protein